MKYKTIIILLLMLLFASTVFGATKYYCPVCGSEDIEITSKDDPKYIVDKESMDNLTKEPVISLSTDSVCRAFTYHYKATCKKCDYTVEYNRCYGCGCNMNFQDIFGSGGTK